MMKMKIFNGLLGMSSFIFMDMWKKTQNEWAKLHEYATEHNDRTMSSGKVIQLRY